MLRWQTITRSSTWAINGPHHNSHWMNRSHLWSRRRACSFCHHVCSISTGGDTFQFLKSRLLKKVLKPFSLQKYKTHGMVAGQITRAMVLDLKYHHNYRAAKPKKTVDLKILRFITHFHFLPQMVMIQLKAFPYLSSLLVIPANQNLDKEDIKTLTFPGYGRSVPLPRWSLGLGSNLHVCLCARDAEQVAHPAWADLQEKWQVGRQSLKVDIILNWSDVVIFLYSGKLKSLHTDNVHYTAGEATCVEINKLINPGSPLIWAPLWGIA